MKRTTIALAPALAAVLLLIGGCSLPGMSFSGPPKSSQGKNLEGYGIQKITPTLLRTQAEKRSTAKVGQSNPALKQAIEQYKYRVKPRDVLAITIWGDPTKTAAFTPNSLGGGSSGSAGQSGTASASGSITGFKVSPDGDIYFPYVGSVHVAGKTLKQVRAQVAKQLKPYINNPQVTVAVAGFNSQQYSISGAIVNPGLYPITDNPRTVAQAISAAGGVLQQTSTVSALTAKPLGDLSRVIYIHDGKTRTLNLRALHRLGDASQNRLVRPGDVIQVPDISFSQIHVIGEVLHPGNYSLDSGHLTLSQALGDAGGINLTTANPARIFVFRGAYRKPRIFWLDARSPAAMLLANDFELKPQDVVFIATAGVSSWNRIITQILPTVQLLYQTKVLTEYR